jgi:hypothetical protein
VQVADYDDERVYVPGLVRPTIEVAALSEEAVGSDVDAREGFDVETFRSTDASGRRVAVLLRFPEDLNLLSGQVDKPNLGNPMAGIQ